MTGSQTINVRGAQLIITTTIYYHTVDVSFTLDLSSLDVDEPDHSPHNIMIYVLPLLHGWHTGQAYWWCKIYTKRRCRTGSQAHRIIKATIARVDDAISKALLVRKSRKSELQIAMDD